MKHENLKMMKHIFLVLMIMSSFSLKAQEGDYTLTGQVTDQETGEGLPGATVLVKGSSDGTITDMDGNYSLQISSWKGTETVVTFSFVGFATKEIKLNGRQQLDVTMATDIASLEEVVVVGYGSVKKSDATGSVAVVSTDDFNPGVINSPQELIVGKVPGVSVTTQTGAPGNQSTIRIRGGSSMSASNDPLIVVDGVPLNNSRLGGSPNVLSFLNPNDIASFTILKDASATAIYGSRAANGVIIITTKRGEGKMKVAYNLTTSLYTAPKKVDVYNGDEFRALINDVYEGNTAVTNLLGEANTDWQDEIYKTAFGQDHNLSLSGSYKHMPYRVSLGYNNTDGILKTYNFERTTISIGLDPSFFNDRLQLKINVKGMNNNNNFADQGAIGSAVAYDPTKPVFDGNARWRGYTTWTVGGVDGTAINLAPANPVAQLALTDNTSNEKSSIGNIQFDYEILEGLHANLNLGYDYAEASGHNNVKDSTQWVYTPTVAGGRINPYVNNRQNELLDFYFSYQKDLDQIDSKVDATAGYSWSHFYRSSADSLTNELGTESTQSNDFSSEYFLVSFFGRLNYNLKDRYLLTLTLRNDATSRFSPEARWGLFPAAALAWNIGNESFLRESDSFSDLKLRLGYGVTGQQDLGNDYPYIATYTISDNAARYAFGNSFYNTLRPDGYDANIKWETTKTANIGVDYGFLKNRITGSLDFYLKKTSDLLNTVDVPAGTNFTARILTNVGSMENKGVEFNVNAKLVASSNFNWDLGYNVYYNENKITKLNLNDDPDYYVPTGGVGGTTSGTIQAQKVNYPVNSFFTYQQVYDAAGNPIEDVYVDRNDDGVINSSDLYIHRKPAADVTMGINSYMNYKNWDFTFVGRLSLGNYLYNNVASGSTYNALYSSMGFLRNTATFADDTRFYNALNTRFSDHYIEDASFFRLDNVNLAYNLRDLFDSKFQMRLSLGVQNAFVISNYSGLDPEVSGGIDNNFYPRTRVFLLGVNCQF
ncbi:MAG: TonB-dependent receptor [Marinoscillum sp.]